MSYTDVFGGNLIFPSRVSYLALTIAIDAQLQWPTEQQIAANNYKWRLRGTFDVRID